MNKVQSSVSTASHDPPYSRTSSIRSCASRAIHCCHTHPASPFIAILYRRPPRLNAYACRVGLRSAPKSNSWKQVEPRVQDANATKRGIAVRKRGREPLLPAATVLGRHVEVSGQVAATSGQHIEPLFPRRRGLAGCSSDFWSYDSCSHTQSHLLCSGSPLCGETVQALKNCKAAS